MATQDKAAAKAAKKEERAAKGAKKRSGSAAKDEGPKRAPFDDEAT